jgi:manganese/iron transport system ATP-binding protein
MKTVKLSDEPARLEFSQVTAGYDGHPALIDLTFNIPHGAQVAVVGPNGAGKSTLFKALVGIVPISIGHIFIHGMPLGHHQDCVAYLPQREEIDWSFPVTVEDVVMMGRFGKFGWLDQPKKNDHQIVMKSLEQLGIANLSKRSIKDLSGGQQQRVFLARAVAQEPHILLMDEPFTGIDATTQETTLRLLAELKARNVTVLVSTHDLNLAAERFELIILLNKKLIAYGSPSEVLVPEFISKAFGHQVLYISGGGILVDECCPPDEDSGGHR